MVVARILEYPKNFSFRLKPEAAIQRYSVKKGLKKLTRYLKENNLSWSLVFLNTASWRSAILLKRDSSIGVSLYILQHFLKFCFEGHLQMATSFELEFFSDKFD